MKFNYLDCLMFFWHNNWKSLFQITEYSPKERACIMKTKLLFSVLFLFLATEGFSRNGKSSLHIEFSQENYFTYIFQVGNQSYRTDGTLFIDDLQAGFHLVQIFQLQGRNRKLVYNGGVNLAFKAITFANFRSGNFFVTQVVPDFDEEIIYLPILTSSMNDAPFNRFKQSIEEEWFDSGRVEALQMALQFNYFDAYQIRVLMDILSFDSSKLQFAKIAFARVVDPENYYLVCEGLTFSSSKRELNAYINSQLVY